MAKDTEGFRELGNKFVRLKAIARGRVMRQAANFAMTPVQKTASNLAPRGTQPHKTYKGRVVAPGFLSRSIKKKVTVSRDKSTVWARVGMHKEAFYGMFLHTEVKRQQRKDDFLTKSYGINRHTVLARYSAKLSQAILKEAKR